MPIEIRNNTIWIIRSYQFVDVDVERVSYDATNPMTWKTKTFHATLEQQLDIVFDTVELLHEYLGSNPKKYYCAWLKTDGALYYIDVSHKAKDNFTLLVKKTTLREQYLKEAEVIDEYFAKTKSEVFYVGKKIKIADAETFEKPEKIEFYTDKHNVYSYNTTNGLAYIAILPQHRFFIPYSWYFADRQNIYKHSSWTEKIEVVENEAMDTQARSNLADVLDKNIYEGKVPPKSEKEIAEIYHSIITYEDLFRYFFPDADAFWNNQKIKLK